MSATPTIGQTAPPTASRAEELLHAIIEGTSVVAGREFFQTLVRYLASGLGVRYSFVAECIPDDRSRSLAAWFNGQAGPEFEYPIAEAPCREVMKGRTAHFQCDLQRLFSGDKDLVTMEAQSYLGVPLRDAGQRVIGHLVIMDDKPMPPDPLTLSVMETFANRAGVELERMRAFENLRRQFEESEQRFRDLFDEAPIAYVHEGLDTRFISANQAAMQILGIKPEEIKGTYGRTFIPDTPDAQRRLKEALDIINRGEGAAGVVLELRRKDNGKPIFIQWWSKPDRSGTFTRTMFIDITERVLMEREKARLEAQNSYLQEEIRSEHNYSEIIGNSPPLLEVLRSIDQVAETDSTVLIMGETGTGKELVARAIHDRSARRSRPLVKVNCGAISAGLVESELFGHVKGSFTGALTNRDGRFKLADGGTIFLDEVGELPMDIQVKLLRVLQEQEFEPIGSSHTIKVDARVIAATNRDLGGAIAEGKFRSDLFYRLNVFPMRVPALRERSDDIPLLAKFFVQRFAQKLNRPIKQIAEDTMSRLRAYPWPGNIRELQNVIERAVVLSQGPVLSLAPDFGPAPASAPASIGRPQPVKQAEPARAEPAESGTPSHSLEDVERRHITTMLTKTNWRIEGDGGAAKALNLQPSTLRSRMQKLGIKRPGQPA